MNLLSTHRACALPARNGRVSIVRRVLQIVSGAGAALLVSCAEPPPPPVPMPAQMIRPAPAPVPVHRVVRRIPRPKSKPPVPGTDETVAAAPPQTQAPSVSEPPSAAKPPAIELVGLDQKSVAHLLGPASETSEQAPGDVWRYKTGNCELDLMFYMELRSGSMRALQYSLKDDTAATASLQDCLQTIVERHQEEQQIAAHPADR
jgi:hypothetical protein